MQRILRNINVEKVEGGYIIRWWYWEDQTIEGTITRELKSTRCVRTTTTEVVERIKDLLHDDDTDWSEVLNRD